ncbi:unnamed protein product [Thelazia callipaeda]|uniref:Uncharacterized protein n=1 Tax=Thelazia callipaeda TaxID=103827 RepID=A0A0N5CQJ7_THECL|nr:unnamed protein product [Thelazia callipaeda]
MRQLVVKKIGSALYNLFVCLVFDVLLKLHASLLLVTSSLLIISIMFAIAEAKKYSRACAGCADIFVIKLLTAVSGVSSMIIFNQEEGGGTSAPKVEMF